MAAPSDKRSSFKCRKAALDATTRFFRDTTTLRNFGGITTADVDLPRLQETVRGDFDPDLQFFILSANGRFVFDPDPSRIMRKSIFDLAKETTIRT